MHDSCEVQSKRKFSGEWGVEETAEVGAGGGRVGGCFHPSHLGRDVHSPGPPAEMRLSALVCGSREDLSGFQGWRHF